MKVTDFVRLKKLMMLASNNTNDAEAIRAFRAATEIVRTHGYTWEQVMDRRVTVLSAVEVADEGTIRTYTPPPAPIPADNCAIEDRDFEIAFSNAQGTFRETLESIYEQWEQGKSLSPRQIKVVKDAAERAR